MYAVSTIIMVEKMFNEDAASMENVELYAKLDYPLVVNITTAIDDHVESVND